MGGGTLPLVSPGGFTWQTNTKPPPLRREKGENEGNASRGTGSCLVVVQDILFSQPLVVAQVRSSSYGTTSSLRSLARIGSSLLSTRTW